MTKVEHWIAKHQHLLPAIPMVQGEDDFLALLRQVQRDYVRLSDAETLKLAKACWEGTEKEAAFARDMLVRHAAPIALEIAFNYSTRFGGVLEAWDGALYQLSKLLPRLSGSEKPRKVGWNGEMAGVRWLCWVQLKLNAELPDTAARLVDEKRASGAPAAIASARSRLLTTTGNDAELYDWLLQPVEKTQYRKHLPAGRKNLVVKKGNARFTRKVLVSSLPRLTAALMGKPQLVMGLQGLISLTASSWTKDVPEAQVRVLPMTPRWIAAAVRANARMILRRPRLAERTRQDAERHSRVSELWVSTNAKSHKLDALVGEDDDQRLADIMAAEVTEQTRFEAPLHRVDEVRALSAYRKYGPVYGEALTKLPVRQLLPLQRTRLRERAVRDAFAAFCERAGQPEHGHRMVAAANRAMAFLQLPVNSSPADVRTALMGVQDALRGRKPAKGRVTAFGAALNTALAGTRLQAVTKTDQEIAVALKKEFKGLRYTFSLAAAYVYGRKLAQQGKADRLFVEACRKAGLRIKIAEEALALVKDTPLTTRHGERVRVTTGKGYVRPWQLALEAHALSVSDRADAARQTVLTLATQIQHAEQLADTVTETAWLDLLDTQKALQVKLDLATRVSDVLTQASVDLEESCTDLNLTRALQAIMAADDVLDDHMVLQHTEAWWSEAYWALTERPAPAGQVLFDAEVPF